MLDLSGLALDENWVILAAPEGDVLHRRSHPRRTSDTPLVNIDIPMNP
jgi:hypothetical protein